MKLATSLVVLIGFSFLLVVYLLDIFYSYIL